MIGSKTGGTSIEDIAAADPTAIIRTPVDIISGGAAGRPFQGHPVRDAKETYFCMCDT